MSWIVRLAALLAPRQPLGSSANPAFRCLLLIEYAEVQNLRDDGERGKAWIKLNTLLEQSIDGSF